jgi:hypothetical protein
MTLIQIAFVAVVAGVILLFGVMYWLESRRPEFHRATEPAAQSDPPTADTSSENRGPRPRHD